MKTSFAAAAILIIFALATPSAPAQQGTGAFQCIATAVVPGSSHATIYVSGMVPGDQSQRIAMTNAWSAYVRGAYPQQNFSTTLCNPGTADPANQQRVIATEQSAWQRAGMEVVFVNWRRGSSRETTRPKPTRIRTRPRSLPKTRAGRRSAADAQTAPPPADPGPQPRTSYCYSDDKKPTVYFSDAFDTADLPSSKAWSTAFSKMLAEKYAYKGTVTCKDGDTIFNVQSTIRDQKDALQGKQAVDTDWTYEPPAPGDPAPADAAAPAKTTPPKHATTHKPQ